MAHWLYRKSKQQAQFGASLTTGRIEQMTNLLHILVALPGQLPLSIKEKHEQTRRIFHQALAMLVTLAALALPLHAQPQDVIKSEAQIGEVVESFRTAIITKDRPRFMSLFHSMAIPWLAVYDENSS